MALPRITLCKIEHRNKLRIGLKFDKDRALISKVKSIPTVAWSQTKLMWLVDFSDDNVLVIYDTFQGIAAIDDSKLETATLSTRKPYHHITRELSDAQRDLLKRFHNYLEGKRYSESTIRTYVSFVTDFIAFNSSYTTQELTNALVDRFIEGVIIKRKMSVSSQRQFISALKLFIVFDGTTQIDNLELKRPKRSKYLPIVLSKHEIIYLLQKTPNLKHRVILMLLYSCGLRISELLHLRRKDIDLERRQLYIHQSKGRKDRYVGLAEVSMPLILNYLNTYEPEHYFIVSSNENAYSASAVRAFLRRSCKEAGITKRVTPHTLRHSYATHLLEQGVDIRYIQTLLGHSRPETTMIYTHVTRQDVLEIKNPLDVAVDKFKKTDKQQANIRLSSGYSL